MRRKILSCVIYLSWILLQKIPSSSLSNETNLHSMEEYNILELKKALNSNIILQKCELDIPESSNPDFIDAPDEEDKNFDVIPWKIPESLITNVPKELKFSLVRVGQEWCDTKRTFKIVQSSKALREQDNLPLHSRSPDVRFVDNITLSENGDLSWIDINEFRHSRQAHSFCVIDSSGKNKLEFEICQLECTGETPCASKCCPEHQIIDAESRRCITTETYWNPTFYSDVKKKNNTARQYSLNIGLPYCTQTYLIQSNQDNKYPNLLLNGTMVLINVGGHSKRTMIEPGQFCIDGIYDSLFPNNGSVVTYSESEWDQVIIGCSTGRMEIPSWIPPLYATIYHTSALFLFITALVYLLLWSHQTIHGWLQFSYVVSLFFAFSLLAIDQVWSREIYNASPDICAFLGWFVHMNFLSAFFWLTSMNVDLWWRFSDNRSLRRIGSHPYRENVNRFFHFASISLGFPVLISGSAAALDFIYRENPSDAWIKLPSYGAKKCYFEDKRSQFSFLSGPVSVLVLINWIIFACVVHCYKRMRNMELTMPHWTLEDKNCVRLIKKLLIVVTVLRILEFVSWVADVFLPNSEALLVWMFLPTDILNSLLGFAIFVIFIYNRDVVSKLKSKYKPVECRVCDPSNNTMFCGRNLKRGAMIPGSHILKFTRRK